MTINLEQTVTLYRDNLIAGAHEVTLREIADAFWNAASADVRDGSFPMRRAWPVFVGGRFGTWDDAAVTDAIDAAVYELRPWGPSRDG